MKPADENQQPVHSFKATNELTLKSPPAPVYEELQSRRLRHHLTIAPLHHCTIAPLHHCTVALKKEVIYSLTLINSIARKEDLVWKMRMGRTILQAVQSE